jgi:hypothetical protein
MNEKLKNKIRREIENLKKALEWRETGKDCEECYNDLWCEVKDILDNDEMDIPAIEERIAVLQGELKKLERIDGQKGKKNLTKK